MRSAIHRNEKIGKHPMHQTPVLFAPVSCRSAGRAMNSEALDCESESKLGGNLVLEPIHQPCDSA